MLYIKKVRYLEINSDYANPQIIIIFFLKTESKGKMFQWNECCSEGLAGFLDLPLSVKNSRESEILSYLHDNNFACPSKLHGCWQESMTKDSLLFTIIGLPEYSHSQASVGNWSQDPVDTKICGCSSSLYKRACLHIAYAYSPIYLNNLQINYNT